MVDAGKALDSGKVVRILYTNYKGETAVRRILPKELRFGSNKWHSEPQWLLVAHDLDKGAERTFACKDIKEWRAD